MDVSRTLWNLDLHDSMRLIRLGFFRLQNVIQACVVLWPATSYLFSSDTADVVEPLEAKKADHAVESISMP